MLRVVAPTLIVSLSSGCHSREQFLAMQLDLGDEVAQNAGISMPSQLWARSEIARVAAAVQRLARGSATPIEALNAVVFDDLGFRTSDVHEPRNFLLPLVLRQRVGDCLGLTGLYVAIGERLGWPIAAVVVPSHAFARWRGSAAARNIELLARGAERSDAHYTARFAVPAGVSAYMRNLSHRELVALYHFNLGNEQSNARHFGAAARFYQKAAALMPDLPRAHASHGRVLHLLGRLDAAAAAYARAMALHPHLPGLAGNIALLDAAAGAAQQRDGSDLSVSGQR
jgi:regulator of sirC expression with transglutaminase-like and TPR domain